MQGPTFAEATQAVRNLQSELGQVDSAYKRTRDEMHVDQAHDVYKAAKHEARVATDAVENQDTGEGELALAKREVARVQEAQVAECGAAKHEVEQALTRADVAEKERAALLEEAQSSQAACVDTVALLETQRQQNIKLFSSLKRKLEENCQKGKELVAQQAEQMEAAEAILARAIKDSEAEAGNKKEKIAQLTAEYEAALQTAQVQLETAESAHEQAKQTHDQRQVETKALEERLVAELKDAEENLKHVTSAEAEADMNAKRIAREIEEISSSNTALSEATTQHQAIESKMNEAEFEAECKADELKELQEANADSAAIQAAQDDCDFHVELHEEVKAEFDNKSTAVQALKAAADTELQVLREQLEGANAQLDLCKKEHASKETELSELVSSHATQRVDAEAAADSIAAAGDVAKNNVEDITEQIQTLKQKHAEDVESIENLVSGAQAEANGNVTALKETHAVELSDQRGREETMSESRRVAKQAAVDKKGEGDACKKKQAAYLVELKDKTEVADRAHAAAIEESADKKKTHEGLQETFAAEVSTANTRLVEAEQEIEQAKSAPSAIQRLQERVAELDFNKKKAMHPEVEDFESCIIYRDEIKKVRDFSRATDTPATVPSCKAFTNTSVLFALQCTADQQKDRSAFFIGSALCVTSGRRAKCTAPC